MNTRYMNMSLCVGTLLFAGATVVAYSSGPIPTVSESYPLRQNLMLLTQGYDEAFDDIMITGKVNFDDTVITSKIKAALRIDPLTSSLAIEIDTKDGMVVVQGVVPSSDVRNHLIQLVAAVEGVRNVRSNLRIASIS